MYSLGVKANIVVMTAHTGGLQDRICKLLMRVTGGLDRALLLYFCLIGRSGIVGLDILGAVPALLESTHGIMLPCGVILCSQ